MLAATKLYCVFLDSPYTGDARWLFRLHRFYTTLLDSTLREFPDLIGLADVIDVPRTLHQYLTELIKQIVAVLDALRPMRTNVEVQDITLSAELLSPVGIIINELITNSVRHAFGDADAPLENSSGFGLQLVGALAGQIGAVSRIERGDGTRFIFEFAAD